MPDLIKRSPRFERGGNPPAIELTERDIEIIQAVHKYRFLDSDQIGLLVGGSRQNLLRRLALLFQHRHLDRPRSQLEYFSPIRNRPLVYGLGNAGADMLSERFSIPRKKIDWQVKNQAAKRLFLRHSILTADVTVKLETACRRVGDTRLINGYDILQQCPIATRQKQNPFRWSVRFLHDGSPLSLGIDPDDIFGLEFRGEQQGRGPAFFFLEADRATMPVERSGFERTSIFRKMLAYHESWRQGLHERHFGISRFCVLFVTTSAERIETMIESNRHFNARKGSAQFLFADASILKSPTPLMHPVLNGSGETLTLLDLIR
jgi:hypothetical protein